MLDADQGAVTRLLENIRDGDRQATDQLLPLVYGELRRLAQARMAKEPPGHTLQPTALVHEAYLRLLGDGDLGWDSRGHFFAAASEAMRRILIEAARRKRRVRHGGELHRTTLGDEAADAATDPHELLALDWALDRLGERDADMAAVVKLRYFGGLSVDETAKALEISPRTVNRLWSGARAWLHREMTRAPATL